MEIQRLRPGATLDSVPARSQRRPPWGAFSSARRVNLDYWQFAEDWAGPVCVALSSRPRTIPSSFCGAWGQNTQNVYQGVVWTGCSSSVGIFHHSPLCSQGLVDKVPDAAPTIRSCTFETPGSMHCQPHRRLVLPPRHRRLRRRRHLRRHRRRKTKSLIRGAGRLCLRYRIHGQSEPPATRCVARVHRRLLLQHLRGHIHRRSRVARRVALIQPYLLL